MLENLILKKKKKKKKKRRKTTLLIPKIYPMNAIGLSCFK